MKKLLLPILLISLGATLAVARTDPPHAELTGIVYLPHYKCALLEISDRPEPLTLKEGERKDSIEVVAIDGEAGAVKLSMAGMNGIVTLSLKNQTNASGRIPGPAFPGIQLQSAALNHVLLLYGELTDRTVLRPTLVGGPFSLQASATNQAEAALVLSKAFAEKGLATIMDGDKFVMVVPADKISMALPHSAEIKSQPPASDPAKPGTPAPAFNSGEINFPAVDISIAAMIYGELLGGRKLDASRTALPAALISVHTQTPLTKEEAIYVFETLFRWQGIKLVPVDKGFVKVVRIADQ